FREIGIQVFSDSDRRDAWGGSPRYLGRIYPREAGDRIYVSRTQLYTLLVHETVGPAGEKIVVDVPLEVNFRISNRFLRSTGLGEILSSRFGEEVEFGFWKGGSQGRGGKWNDIISDRGPNSAIDQNGVTRVFGLVETSLGDPLAQLTVKGRSLFTRSAEKQRRRMLAGGILLVLCVIITTRSLYHRLCESGRSTRAWPLLLGRRILALIVSLAVIRFILLRLDLPSGFAHTNLFDPALFADDFPGGLMRTAGDFLITALFFLILVFGSVKAFRTYFGGVLERRISGWTGFNLLRMLLKGLLIAGVLYAMTSLCDQIVSRAVLNSNPRLIGLDAEFYSMPVLMLHLALLLYVSAILIAAIFLMRLVFVWGGGRVSECVPAAVAGFVAAVYFGSPHWTLVVGAAGLTLLSTRIFPLLKKEEALSVIFASFFLVLICSLVIFGTSFVRYDQLRKGRIEERLKVFNDPDDNWIMIVLPDVCEGLFNSRSAVAKVMTGDRSAAFELWAESGMSKFGFSCTFDVFDARGRKFSSFSVGMPLGVSAALPETLTPSHLPDMKKKVLETERGRVHFLLGIAPLYNLNGTFAGQIEIGVPFFYENPELLVKAGPNAPEIFQNVESGSFAPRIDEPEDLLVARLVGDMIEVSSSPDIPAGTIVRGDTLRWIEIPSDAGTYTCIRAYGTTGGGFLAGYRKTDFVGLVLQWAMVISLDIILAVFSLCVLFVVRRLPVLGSVVPAVHFSTGLSFRRKLLLSFLAVSVMPVLLMGIFSGRYIRYRFKAEGDREAVSSAESAMAFFRHSIRAEAEAFAESRYFRDVLEGTEEARIGDVTRYGFMQFALWDGHGNLLLDESLSDFDSSEAHMLIARSRSGDVLLSYSFPYLYGGTVIEVPLPGRPSGYVYYRRRIDDDFVNSIAGVTGRNLNVYFEGVLRASSETDLFAGGFIDPLLSPATYSRAGLGGSRMVLEDQSLGGYTYKVASVSLPAIRSGENGVLSVPLLYRTGYIRTEIMRSYALIMGLLALLFSAAVTLGVFLAGKIINPIAALRGGTMRIIAGDLEFRLEAEAQDEIGDLVGSFNTMTEALREARRDLLERQRYLSAILDSVATGVLSTGSDGRIITMNPSAEKMLGVAAGDLTGSKPAEAGVPHLKPLLDLFSARGDGIREEEITLIDGEDRRTFKTVITSLSEGGDNLGTVVVFDDLTELIRTKKLSAWVEMARQIAHEVKNPLTPIKLSAQLMKRAYDEKREEFDEIFEDGVDTVIQQTEILRKIASEFSSFGRAAKLRRERIRIREFIAAVMSGYRGAGGIEIRVDEGPEVEVWADREALRKILVNLLENAIDAMPEGGTIDVEVGAGLGQAEVTVVDSGTGLPDDVEMRLFEPYFSTKTNGTGLGLAICRNLATEMDGDIVLRNRTDARGVKAVVTLPLAPGSTN
ncbi:MAG TPA: ATP-binding protein, partial [Candidatus Krumholzibacterium sp.]|nr:ATP-binding protein [Candidatus Krumholzibacterium sp.]